MAVPDPGKLPFQRRGQRPGTGMESQPLLQGATRRDPDPDGRRRPGLIQHIWLVADPAKGTLPRPEVLLGRGGDPLHRDPRLRFLRRGHNRFARVNSLAVTVNPKSAFNCYWPCPSGAGPGSASPTKTRRAGASHLPDYLCREPRSPTGPAIFTPSGGGPSPTAAHPNTSSSRISGGRASTPGPFLAWTQLCDGWFGEGELKFFIDGDRKFPTICGTGTEDYFCGSFGSPRPTARPTPATCSSIREKTARPSGASTAGTSGNPICFQQDLRVTIRPWAGGRTASTSRWPTTSPRWPTGTRPNRTCPFRSCRARAALAALIAGRPRLQARTGTDGRQQGGRHGSH